MWQKVFIFFVCSTVWMFIFSFGWKIIQAFYLLVIKFNASFPCVITESHWQLLPEGMLVLEKIIKWDVSALSVEQLLSQTFKTF